MSAIFLIGKKTVLRPISVSDIVIFTKWMNNSETRRYLTQRFPMTETAEESWIKKVSLSPNNPTDVRLVIQTKDEGKPIGTIALHNINWVDRNATTGTIIGEADFRSKGYATDAKMVLLEYAFQTLGMHKIISRAFASNTASIEYSKRCGYTVEATLKDEVFGEGSWQDIVLLACFYPAWKLAAEKR
ncbi:MAG: GNAT family protein [Candidatus Paceibacterota bacterium]